MSRRRVAQVKAPTAATVVIFAFLVGNALAAPVGTLRQLPGKQGCFIDAYAFGVPRANCRLARGMMSSQTVVISPDGRNIYAPSNFSWGVSVFRRDPRTGHVRQLRGKSGCLTSGETPNKGLDKRCAAARGMVWAFWASVSPDGKNVYVTGGIGWQIAVFTRDPSTGALSQPPGAAGCLHNRIGGTSQGGPTSARSGCTLVDHLKYPRSIAMSPDGRFAYVATLAGDGITVFRRDVSTGQLTAIPGGCSSSNDPTCAPAANLDGATDVALSPDGRFVYATAYNGGAVSAFARDNETGTLTQVPGAGGCVAAKPVNGCGAGRGLAGAYNLALSRDGRNLYAVSRLGQAIATFSRNLDTGALTQLPGAAGCVSSKAGSGCRLARGLNGGRGVAVSPDGKTVYAGSFIDSAVTAFKRDRKSGALRQLRGRFGCLIDHTVAKRRAASRCGRGRAIRHAWGIAFSPDGRFVYTGVAGDGNSGLGIFKRVL